MQDEGNNGWVGIVLMSLVLWLILSVTFQDVRADVPLSIDLDELVKLNYTEEC